MVRGKPDLAMTIPYYLRIPETVHSWYIDA